MPNWPLTVLTRRNGAPPDGPFALVERGRHGVVLATVDAEARRLGLGVGQRHADACAMVPRLDTAPADPAADAAALADLARWCLRWSPSVAVDTPDGLFIEVGGSAHLFGGETGLLADMVARLAAAGIETRAAVAPTAAAAWAAARFGGSDTIVGDDIAGAAAAWPLAALRLAPEVAAAAAAMGLQRIDDLVAMPRAGLARRLRDADGLSVVARLDQLLSIAPEALDPIEPPVAHAVRRRFAEPVTDVAGIAVALPGLLDALAAGLGSVGLGATGLRLAAARVDGQVTEIAVRLGASRDPALWGRLLRERGLDALDLGFGIDALVLAAPAVTALAEASPDLSTEPAHESLSQLIDRLAARLGAAAVLVAGAYDSWLPERGEGWRPAQGTVLAAEPPLDRPRPLLLLAPPEPIEASLFEVPEGAPTRFRWRRVDRRIRRAEGPERLSPEWWRGLRRRPRRTRDYYRVEDDTGARFWLFREGLYDWEDQDRPPTWWLHGLFA